MVSEGVLHKIIYAGIALFLSGSTGFAANPVETGNWVPLGGDLNPMSTDYVYGPALAADPRRNPVLAFSTYTGTWALRWAGGDWVSLGYPPAAGGPALGIDGQKHIYLCSGYGGPYVSRWDGMKWINLGGNISIETGYKGQRYGVDACGGIALDSSDTPVVTWSADTGAKSNSVFAARWDRRGNKWVGLGQNRIGDRATNASIAIDKLDRIFIATWKPGGSYGGVQTTRVWTWDGAAWVQLGSTEEAPAAGDMPNTLGPVLAVDQTTLFLALSDASGAVRVMRWLGGAWQDLPSPGQGSGVALALTPAGKPIVAYLEESATASTPSIVQIRVKYLIGHNWYELGEPLADVTGKSTELALTVDALGHPTVAWRQIQWGSAGTPDTSDVFVKQYSEALP